MSVAYEDVNGTVYTPHVRAKTNPVNSLGQDCGSLSNHSGVYTGDESCSEVFKSWDTLKEHVNDFVNNEMVYHRYLTSTERVKIYEAVLRAVERIKDHIFRDKDIAKLNKFIQTAFVKVVEDYRRV